MKTVRLGSELESRLDELARVTGQPVSEIIREAVRRYCDEIPLDRLADRLSDVIGAVSGGGSSRGTGREFAELIRKKDQSRLRRGR